MAAWVLVILLKTAVVVPGYDSREARLEAAHYMIAHNNRILVHCIPGPAIEMEVRHER